MRACFLCGQEALVRDFQAHIDKCVREWRKDDPTRADLVDPAVAIEAELGIKCDTTMTPEVLKRLNTESLHLWKHKSLFPCAVCGRTFNKDRLALHQKGCHRKEWTHRKVISGQGARQVSGKHLHSYAAPPTEDDAEQLAKSRAKPLHGAFFATDAFPTDVEREDLLAGTKQPTREKRQLMYYTTSSRHSAAVNQRLDRDKVDKELESIYSTPRETEVVPCEFTASKTMTRVKVDPEAVARRRSFSLVLTSGGDSDVASTTAATVLGSTQPHAGFALHTSAHSTSPRCRRPKYRSGASLDVGPGYFSIKPSPLPSRTATATRQELPSRLKYGTMTRGRGQAQRSTVDVPATDSKELVDWMLTLDQDALHALKQGDMRSHSRCSCCRAGLHRAKPATNQVDELNTQLLHAQTTYDLLLARCHAIEAELEKPHRQLSTCRRQPATTAPPPPPPPSSRPPQQSARPSSLSASGGARRPPSTMASATSRPLPPPPRHKSPEQLRADLARLEREQTELQGRLDQPDLTSIIRHALKRRLAISRAGTVKASRELGLAAVNL